MDKTRKALWFAIGFVCGWQAIPWMVHIVYIATIIVLLWTRDAPLLQLHVR